MSTASGPQRTGAVSAKDKVARGVHMRRHNCAVAIVEHQLGSAYGYTNMLMTLWLHHKSIPKHTH